MTETRPPVSGTVPDDVRLARLTADLARQDAIIASHVQIRGRIAEQLGELQWAAYNARHDAEWRRRALAGWSQDRRAEEAAKRARA